MKLHEIKRLSDGKMIHTLPEEVDSRGAKARKIKPFPVHVLLANWDKEIYVKGGYTAEMQPHERGKTFFIIKELMNDEELGKAYIFQRAVGGSTYWWALHHADGSQAKVQSVAPPFDQQIFAEWLAPLLPKLRKSS